MSAEVESAENLLDKQLESLSLGDKDLPEKQADQAKGDAKNKQKVRRFVKRDRRSDEERYRELLEKQKSKQIVETRMTGTVKWYSIRGHYGFIERADGKGDVFVHQSSISKSHTEKFYLRTLAEKQDVEFDLAQAEKGLEAVNVSGPDGTAVKEIRNRYYPRRPFRKVPSKRGNEEKNLDTKRGNPKKAVDGATKADSNEAIAENNKSEKPRRPYRPRYHRNRKPKTDGEVDGDEKVKHERRRRRDKSV